MIVTEHTDDYQPARDTSPGEADRLMKHVWDFIGLFPRLSTPGVDLDDDALTLRRLISSAETLLAWKESMQ